MKILIVPGSEGSISQIRPEFEMFVGMMKRGHDITIVIKPDCLYLPRLRELGVRVLHCYPTKKVCVASILALRQELSRNAYDIIFANGSRTISNAAFAAIGFSVQMVAYRGTVRGAYWHDPSNYLTLFHPRVDGIVCVAEAVRQYLLPKFSRRKTRLVTIHKGHDLSWYKKPPADLSEFGITDRDFTIACVANARPHKGVSHLLKAAKALSDIDNLHILLVGRNINVEPYVSLIAGSNMAERIHQTGFRHDAPELIAASKLLVLPSVAGEGLPRVVLESMGYGIPPIVTDTAGTTEVVDDGRNGYVVPPGDSGAIAERVRHLIANPGLLERMSAECLKTIDNEMSIRVAIQRHIDFFENLLK